MTPSYPPRCPSCRKAKDVRGLTDAEFDAIYDPATRRSDSGKGTSAKTIRLGGLPSPMSDEVLYALQDRDRQGLALNLYAVAPNAFDDATVEHARLYASHAAYALHSARRRAGLPAAPDEAPRGYAALYDRHVTQAPEGCDFDFLQHPDLQRSRQQED